MSSLLHSSSSASSNSNSSNPSETFSGDDDLDNLKLCDLFDRGWRLQRELSKSSVDESSDQFLLKRKKSLEILKKCEFMLDELNLFSENEDLDEVSTSEIRYFLNYALLGWLYSKVNSSKSDIRLVALEQARNYYCKYLKLTRNYGMHSYKASSDSQISPANQKCFENKQAEFDANLVNMAYERNEKIKRYKEQRELEKQLETLNIMLDKNPELVDDENRRKTYLTSVKYWINKAIDEMKIVNDEITILSSIELDKKDVNEKRMQSTASATVKEPPKKPFIITRDALQAQVFGAGYPSLPVYSVEEFYDHLAVEGKMPKPNDPNERLEPVKIGGGVTDSQKDKEKEEKDLREDAHDEEELRKQREWDEFKDENKRGSGNRYNRS